ncbi:MAG: DNA primase [Caldisericia bacterium]
MITQETIDEVIAKANILDVIQTYRQLKRSGKYWRCLCPFHNEKTPSFTVNETTGTFYCFGCEKNGNVIKFVMEMEKMTFPETIRHLAAKYGITVSETKEKEDPQSTKRQLLFNVMDDAAFIFAENLRQNPAALEYLASRGIKADTIKKWKLGLADKNIGEKLSSKYSADLLKEAGLITDKGAFFYDRLMVPILDPYGHIVAFSGRTNGEQNPKYLNSKESIIFSKSRMLFGLNFAAKAIRTQNFVIIVEGYFDVILLHQFGFENVVATMGTATTSYHALLLQKYCESVLVMFDPDTAGQKATLRSIDAFLSNGLYVKVASIPGNDDPDEFVEKNGKASFIRVLDSSKDFVDYIIDESIITYGLTPQGKSKIIKKTFPYINKVKDPVAKSEYLKKLSVKVSVAEHLIESEFRAHKDENVSVSAAIKSTSVTESNSNLAEMDMLSLLIRNPAEIKETSKVLPGDRFGDSQCQLLYLALVSSQSSEPENVTHVALRVDESLQALFARLSVRVTIYKDEKKAISLLAKTINQQKQRERFESLHREIGEMAAGTIPNDDGKILEYQSLLKQFRK